MSELAPNILLDEKRIRREWHENEWYYSIIDVVAVIRDVDYSAAQNYYHVLKKRLNENEEAIPSTLKFKARCMDRKLRLTDFSNQSGIQFLLHCLEPNIQNQYNRLNVRKSDEVAIFQPKVISKLNSMGWHTEQQVELPSGAIIDIVGKYNKEIYIIECKPELYRAKLYSAIGQVLCYRAEYEINAIPVIATYKSAISEYAQISCASSGIKIIEVNDL